MVEVAVDSSGTVGMDAFEGDLFGVREELSALLLLLLLVVLNCDVVATDVAVSLGFNGSFFFFPLFLGGILLNGNCLKVANNMFSASPFRKPIPHALTPLTISLSCGTK